ncbi:MAG: DUF3311 domain-containing protein [Nocardioidaceae bacterium]
MSQHTPAPDRTPTASGRSTARVWGVVALLLGIGIVVPLLVFLYDRPTPTLFGFPFYYWFQFLMIPIVSALTYTAFRLSVRATAQDRSTRASDASGADR